MFKQVDRASLGDSVWEQFVDKLNSGYFKFGEKLPSENEMCKQLQVSRPVLREVLRTLRYMGYIESVQGGGNYISRMPLSSTFSTIKLKLAMEQSVVIKIWELRYIIEVETAGLAAERATDAEIAEIEAALQNYGEQVANGASRESLSEAGEKFHEAITKAAHNEILTDTLDGLSGLLDMTRDFSNQIEGSTGRAVTGHLRILQTIAEHDSEGARLAMKEHLLKTREDLQEYFSSLESDQSGSRGPVEVA